MDSYKVRSAFGVANQIVHVDVCGKNGQFSVLLPIKFKPFLENGTKFNVFVDENKKHIAYRFKNQLLFASPVLNDADAKVVLKSIAGLTKLSFDRLFFKYSVLMAMQNNSIRPCFNMRKNILLLKRENQR